MKFLNIALFILLCSTQLSFAQSEQKIYSSSWTLSTLPLVTGVAQVRAEFSSESDFSYSVLGGAGISDGYSYNPGPHPLFLLGTQINYYLIGNFQHGMQTGLQVAFSTTSHDASAASAYYNSGRNVYIIPYIGYKVILSPGFTVNAQIGAGLTSQRIFIATKINSDGKREGYYMIDDELGGLLHLDFGWSF